MKTDSFRQALLTQASRAHNPLRADDPAVNNQESMAIRWKVALGHLASNALILQMSGLAPLLKRVTSLQRSQYGVRNIGGRVTQRRITLAQKEAIMEQVQASDPLIQLVETFGPSQDRVGTQIVTTAFQVLRRPQKTVQQVMLARQNPPVKTGFTGLPSLKLKNLPQLSVFLRQNPLRNQRLSRRSHLQKPNLPLSLKVKHTVLASDQ